MLNKRLHKVEKREVHFDVTSWGASGTWAQGDAIHGARRNHEQHGIVRMGQIPSQIPGDHPWEHRDEVIMLHGVRSRRTSYNSYSPTQEKYKL